MSITPIGKKVSERYLKEVNPKAIPAPQHEASMEVIALRTWLQENDALSGALAGPPRVILGLMELKNARKASDRVDGIGQLAAGSLGTIAGSIGMTGCIGAVAGRVGLQHAGMHISGISAALGGGVTAGYVGGSAALIKGSLDLWRGLRHHERKGQVVGGIKLLCGGMMIAGAACCPPLIVAGTAVYLTTATMANRRLMSKPELGAAAVTIGGVASANPFLVIGGTVAYVGAAVHHNQETLKVLCQRENLKLLFKKLKQPQVSNQAA